MRTLHLYGEQTMKLYVVKRRIARNDGGLFLFFFFFLSFSSPSSPPRRDSCAAAARTRKKRFWIKHIHRRLWPETLFFRFFCPLHVFLSIPSSRASPIFPLFVPFCPDCAVHGHLFAKRDASPRQLMFRIAASSAEEGRGTVSSRITV